MENVIYQSSECYEDPKNCRYHDQPTGPDGFYEPTGSCPFGHEELMKDCPCYNKSNLQIEIHKKRNIKE